MAENMAIGIMDSAFFVGRKEIIEWINQTLQLNIGKIEETASGAIACQLLDSLYPGEVAMAKVNWEAKSDWEFVGNYKLLQTSFNKLQISKHIDVDKLIKGKYQDNLEFMQWFKRFAEIKGGAPGYDPISSRAKGKGAAKLDQSSGGRRNAVGARPTTAPTNSTRPRVAVNPVGARTTVLRTKSKENENFTTSNRRAANAAPAQRQLPTQTLSPPDKAYTERIGELEKEIEALKQENSMYERQADFYYEKLRRIEVLLQAQEADPKDPKLVDDVFKILYEETDEFVSEVEAAAEATNPVEDAGDSQEVDQTVQASDADLPHDAEPEEASL